MQATVFDSRALNFIAKNSNDALTTICKTESMSNNKPRDATAAKLPLLCEQIESGALFIRGQFARDAFSWYSPNELRPLVGNLEVMADILDNVVTSLDGARLQHKTRTSKRK